ncbi:MAG: hypothetical protein NZM28_09695 [Fimbriimonadales bacterium]|nr:hypothetical protein [Fimbriimonadales bacterium]
MRPRHSVRTQQEKARPFAGRVQPPDGAFEIELVARFSRWNNAPMPVKIHLKPFGAEADPRAPIYEWSFTVAEANPVVKLTHAPVGVFAVQIWEYADDEWHLSAPEEPLAIPQAGGTPAPHTPLPNWAIDGAPMDAVPQVGSGGASRGNAVYLASGVLEHAAEPDLTIDNPAGDNVRWQRIYDTHTARQKLAASGLPIGWYYSLLCWLEEVSRDQMRLIMPNGVVRALSVRRVNNQWLMDAPPGDPYRGTGQPDPRTGRWARVRIFFRDYSAWEFAPSTPPYYRLTHVYARGGAPDGVEKPAPETGAFMRLEYDREQRLSEIYSGSGQKLLSLVYKGGWLSQATAHNHKGEPYATVYYTIEDVQGVPCLTKVSQVNNPREYAWEYGYTVRGGVPYMTSTTVPHPGGRGKATGRIVYDPKGNVLMLIDGNENVRAYNYLGTETVVSVYRATGKLDLEKRVPIRKSNAR